MLNLQVNFSCAWLLLLIVPAVLLTLLPYFKLSKKFRKTRNRISSVVLHLTALVLCIFVLSGMTFDYEVHNSENELVLVVDASYSTAEEKQAKDDFVRSVIEMTNTDVYSLGIVTFGLKPVCAVPLTDDLRNAFNLYQNSLQPDVTATDISSALVFARDMLTHPESAKIVLLNGRKSLLRCQIDCCGGHAHRQRSVRLPVGRGRGSGALGGAAGQQYFERRAV